jgi:hypothetical protein
MAALGLGQVLGSLDGARHVLLAGAGGGHDVYAAVPLWWHLRAAGVRVSLASLSFTDGVAMGPEVAEGVACHRVTPEATLIGETFGELAFPELHRRAPTRVTPWCGRCRRPVWSRSEGPTSGSTPSSASTRSSSWTAATTR